MSPETGGEPASIVETLLENVGNEVVLHFEDHITVPIPGRGPLAKTSEQTDKTHIRGTVVETDIQDMDLDDDDYEARFEAWVDPSVEERDRVGYPPQGTTENGRPGFNVYSVRNTAGEWDRPDGRGHITSETPRDFSFSPVTMGNIRSVDADGESTTYDKPFGEDPTAVRIGAREISVDYVNVVRRGDSKSLHVGVDHGEGPRNPFTGAGVGAWEIPERGETVQIVHEPTRTGFDGTFLSARLFDNQLDLQYSIDKEYTGGSDQ